MAKSIFSLVPNAEDLLIMEPEEIAGVILVYIHSFSEQEKLQLNRHNFGLRYTYQEYPDTYHEKIAKVLLEGWLWLEREGFIAPKSGDWYFLTRRGANASGPGDVNNYIKTNLLPKKQLHPRIATKVWATFLRGDYDTAVFQTFKEVEVAVRNAGGFKPEDIGTELMRKAFAPANGPLANKDSPKAEQEALAHLFAGAIGSYKNPHSHRAVAIEPEEAVEMIMLGSHLLKIVDSKSQGKGNVLKN